MSCSVRDVERWNQVNSLLVRTAISCMQCMHENYQAAIWKRSLQSQPFVANPTDGCQMTDADGKLAVNWMRGSPAPHAFFQLLPCKCVRSFEIPQCTCLSKGLKCTDMCRLQTCHNRASDEEPVAQLSDSESDAVTCHNSMDKPMACLVCIYRTRIKCCDSYYAFFNILPFLSPNLTFYNLSEYLVGYVNSRSDNDQ
jgi:hypothetical protein